MKSLFNNKNARVSVLIISFLAVIGLGFLVFGIRANTNYNAELSLVNGTVEQAIKVDFWTKLKSGATVSQGSSIRTSADSRAIITLDDGSAIRLDENSEIQLTSLNPNNIVVTNQKGEVYTRVVKADRSFVVKSDDESYKSLGTAYKTVNTDKEKGVYVYESKVKAEFANKEIPMGSKFLTKASDKGLVKKLVNISNEEITKDIFMQWNKELDKKDKEFKKNLGILKESSAPTATEKPAPESNSSGNSSNNTNPSIYITGSVVDGGIMFNWSMANMDAKSGFKIVKSTSANPTYPGSSAVWADANARSYKLSVADGKTYNFRICRYTGNACDIYSNNILVTAPTSSKPTTTYTYKKVTWTVNESAKTISLNSGFYTLVTTETPTWPANGFKVVWSKTSSPTYPPRSTDEPVYAGSNMYAKIHNFDGSGKYYVRVCEYIPGADCVNYSNQIEVDF